MDKKRRLDLSKYRFERAEKSIAISKRDFSCGDFNESASRSYYAIFYALLSVNELDGFFSSKHSGVIALFTFNYLRTKILDRKISRLINSAFKLRRYADYQSFSIITEDEAQAQIDSAEIIINTIRPYIAKRWAEMENDNQ